MMKDYYVTIQVTRVYALSIEASSKQAAYKKADKMQTLDIHEQGKLKDATVDSIEVDEQ